MTVGEVDHQQVDPDPVRNVQHLERALRDEDAIGVTGVACGP
jgi:hypothetical protein